MNINYRLLSKEDVIGYSGDLRELMDIILKENITQEYSQNISEVYISKLPEYIENNSAILVGAFDKNKLVGFHWGYYVNVFNEKRIHSNFIGCFNEYQGIGVAQNMIKLMEQTAIENNVYIIEAMVTVENDKSMNFHKKNGFEIERVKMRKNLK